MTHSTLEACPAPALVHVIPDSTLNNNYEYEEYDEEQDGCVLKGLLSAMVAYLLIAIFAAGAWRLFHLI